MREERWDVFVSYGHEDASWVGVLAGNLHRDGFEVFLDQWEMVGGDRVTGRLEDAIRRSLNGVLVVSPHSLSRSWVREEYEALLRQAVQDPSRRLIPVLYKDAELPAFMANRLWVDFRGVTTGPGYVEALERLERYLRGKGAGDRPQRGEAPVWPEGATGEVVRPAGSMRLSLVFEAGRVCLRDGAREHNRSGTGFRPATADAVNRLHRLWHRGSSAGDARPPDEDLDLALADVGRRLSSDFLAGNVGAALARAVADAAQLNELLELGIQAPELDELPWETLALPNLDGTVAAEGARGLALHHNVALYREVVGPRTVAAYKVRGPLRILVAIASPESQDEAGELLNYEAELARIVAAVDPVRRGAEAHIRVLAGGSLAAIRSALTAEAEGFHVLHLSCHARPGELILETEDGEQDAVSAQRLLAEGLPAGVDLPMVVLSGCSTGLGLRAEPVSEREDSAQREGELALGGVARQLLQAGVPVVLAMQSPISDSYAADLAAALYGHLASAEVPDALVALSEARRGVEQARQRLSADAPRRGHAEWATPALWVRGLRLPLFNRHEPFGVVAQVNLPVLAEGIVVRKVGEFVGRRRELRLARRAIAGAKAGLVIHGIGGVGKSTFAAEVITSAGAQHVVVSLRGTLSVDRILDELGARLHMLLLAGRDDLAQIRVIAQQLRAGDIEWANRWRALSELIMPSVPILMLLDNFEDNLQRGDAAWGVRDPELADLLSRWIRRPGQAKLVVTSRYPFELPDGGQRRLERLHLGPLSAAETAKLVWQLPGLDALPPGERLRAYRDVGGHPRTLEYLDALLRGGHARFDDVAERMEKTLSERGIQNPEAWIATRDRDADSALAEAITLAVDDVVLGDLLEAIDRTPLARELVIGASVYRVPVDDTALRWQLADESEPALDPDRDTNTRMQAAIEDADKIAASRERLMTLDVGLTDDEIAAYQTDMQDLQRAGVPAPDGFAKALSAVQAIGLITPITRSDITQLYLVHRWTARAIAHMQVDRVIVAHHRAARYWRWRVHRVPQSESDALEQLLEARYHHHAAGEHDAGVQLSEYAILKLQTWGRYGRATELCRDSLQRVTPGSAKAAEHIHQLGLLAQVRGDYDTAEQHYKRSLEISERLGKEAGIANGYHQLGVLAQLRGDYETAERRFTQSLEIEERLGNEAGLASSYHQLGVLAQLRGEYEIAEQRYIQSLELNEPLGEEAGLASSYHQLGVLAQLRGDYETAEQRFTQSHEIKERLGDEAGLATTHHQLGMLAQLRGAYDTAEQRYTQSLEISEQLGDQAGLASSYHQLGVLAQLRGDYDTAEQRFTQSLEISERLDDQVGLASGYHQLGILAHDQGDHDAAEQRYAQSLEISERLGNQAGLANGYHQLGILAQDRGDYDAAEQRYAQSLEISHRLGDQAGLANGYHQLGRLAHDRGDYDAAEQRYTQSLEINERLGNQAGLAMSYSTLAMLTSERGNDIQAVSYELRVLSIRMQMRDERVGSSLQRLAEARLRLGTAAYKKIASQLLSEESEQALERLLDEQAASKDERDDGSAAHAT